MGDDERRLLLDAFDSNWIAPLGPHVDAFELEFCQAIGATHAAALSSGTSALHLALILAGVERGDEVLCSTLTFSASANAIAYLGARPVFLDSEELSWNLDPDLLANELESAAQRGRPPKALVLVHLYGQSADLTKILPLCEQYSVVLVEDAAEALGATWGNRQAGTAGRFGVFSFNGNKIITTSGGGILACKDKADAAAARKLATQSRDPAAHYEHSQIGYNYRLSNLLAAVGRGQIRVLPARIETRRAVFRRYYTAFKEVPGLVPMPEASWGKSTRWLSVFLIDPDKLGVNREDLRCRLEAADIEARPLWKPMHLQPVFRDCRKVGGAVSERLFEQGLCLPSGSAMTHAQQDRVIEIVLKTISGGRNSG
ncbi:MAG: aminotransferase class I/II-fold pyridoxal phosphate-dependent enzyme [Planctomycetes bacterium]|nr:aminotransferase class I/II-fold pyridoxal phosphate-dependent enzyme [Planctomycetota bacterium]